jgi:hypothetical protein
MARKVLRFIIIAGSLFFSFGLLSIGLPWGIGVIILIDIFLFLLTGKKEEVISTVEKVGQWGRDRVEILGEVGKQAAETAGEFVVKSGKVITSGIKAGYRELGGEEGAKKAVNELAKGATEVLKIGGHVVYKTVEAVGDATKAVAKQIEKDRKRKQQEKLLEDYYTEDADYTILDDD